ncbi:MAG: DUF1592 domain-containing protein [bacterium]
MKTRTIATLLTAMGLVACQPGEVNVESQDGEPIPVIEPKVPTSMDDCDGETFAGQAPMRLLTRYEFDYTVEDLLGIPSTVAREQFPPENSVAGFENNSDSHNVSPLLARKLMEAAETLADQAIAQRKDALVGCDVASDGCIEDFVDRFLTRAFRRPATPEEQAIFVQLYEDASVTEGPDLALSMVIQAALQSPQFLYRIELQDDKIAGELVALNGYEVATRLSYFLWGSMPDDTLLQAAASDALNTPEEIEAQTRRMLLSPRARDLVGHFYRQWLGLDALDSMVKDNAAYPEWTPAMTQQWRDSLYAFIDYIHFEKNGDLHDLMTSNEVFMSDELAPTYGFTPTEVGMNAFEAPADQRAGLLTQPAVMALLAYPTQGSPIHRGIFVRERLLCQKLPPPPNNIQITPPDPDPNATTRAIFEQHTAEPACAGCHALIDPIGLGFEYYDGIGRFRTVENGIDVDGSGALGNTADPSIGGPFDGAVALSGMLAEAREVQDCVADHWYTFAMGHPESEADMCAADGVRGRFAASGGTFEDLLVAITTSDEFRYRTIQVPVKGEMP